MESTGKKMTNDHKISFFHQNAPCVSKIFEIQFFTGDKLLSFGCKNGSVFVDSDYFTEAFIFDYKPIGLKKFEFVFKSNSSSDFISFELVEKPIKKKKLKIKINASKTLEESLWLKNLSDKRVRVYKFDSETEIKKFFYSTGKSTQLLVIIPDASGRFAPYPLLGDGSSNTELSITSPVSFGNDFDVGSYTFRSVFALVNDEPYIFGGWSNNHKVSYISNLNQIIEQSFLFQ